MTVDAFKCVQYGSTLLIQDNDNTQCAPMIGASLEQVEAAVSILNQINDRVDLDQVRFESDGLHIGDQLYKPEQVEGYTEKFRQISTVHPPVARKVDHVGGDTVDLHREEMGANALAASGELQPVEDFFADRDVEHHPHSNPPESASSALKSVGQFFKRLKISISVGIFKRIFSPNKYKQHHEAQAQKFMEPTQGKIQTVKERYPEREVGDEYARVPSALLLSQELRDETGLDAKIGGKAAVQKLPDGVVDVGDGFESNGHEVNGYDVRNGGIESGAVVPTSTRYHDDQGVGNHLINCYMTHQNGVGIIRTGVIDTKEKAEEFERAARELHRQMGRSEDQPVRVMSHQLNSPERERKMIGSQHTQLLKRNTDTFQVGHLNAPCNRFYHHHKKLGNVPIISSLLSGEKESHEQNVEGMVQYLDWITEDFAASSDPDVKGLAKKINDPSFRAIRAHQKKINVLFGEIADLEGEIEASTDKDVIKAKKAEIKEKMEEIKFKRNQIIHGDGVNKGLRHLHIYLEKVLEKEELTSENLAGNLELQKASQTLYVYRRLLGAQLDIKGAQIDRNQEHLMLFALDKNLGVISAMNCKSGLDRTGFLFALFLSAMDLPDDKVMEIALNWESYSLELNNLYKNKGYNPELVASELSRMGERGENLKVLFDMQHNVLEHLLKVSLPITGHSTGLIGLKYQKGISENLLPLYCLPPVVKNDEGQVIQILTYDSKGHPKGLTTEGHALVTQLSLYRGA